MIPVRIEVHHAIFVHVVPRGGDGEEGPHAEPLHGPGVPAGVVTVSRSRQTRIAIGTIGIIAHGAEVGLVDLDGLGAHDLTVARELTLAPGLGGGRAVRPTVSRDPVDQVVAVASADILPVGVVVRKYVPAVGPTREAEVAELGGLAVGLQHRHHLVVGLLVVQGCRRRPVGDGREEDIGLDGTVIRTVDADFRGSGVGVDQPDDLDVHVAQGIPVGGDEAALEIGRTEVEVHVGLEEGKGHAVPAVLRGFLDLFGFVVRQLAPVAVGAAGVLGILIPIPVVVHTIGAVVGGGVRIGIGISVGIRVRVSIAVGVGIHVAVSVRVGVGILGAGVGLAGGVRGALVDPGGLVVVGAGRDPQRDQEQAEHAECMHGVSPSGG